MNTLTARTTTVIATKAELTSTLGGLTLAGLTFIPTVVAAAKFAQHNLATAELQQPAAFAGLMLCLLFIPFIHHLSSKRSLTVLLLGVAVCAFSVGICIGLQ